MPRMGFLKVIAQFGQVAKTEWIVAAFEFGRAHE